MLPVQFYNPAQAYMWADEVATRPDARSPTQLAIAAIQQNPRSGLSLSREDVLDAALSILKCVSRIEPPIARMAFKSVYGQPDEARDAELSSRLAKAIHEATERDYSKCARLAHMMILRARAQEQREQRMPFSWYARALMIRRQSLRSWRHVIRLGEQQLEDWMYQGYDKARFELEQLGALKQEDRIQLRSR